VDDEVELAPAGAVVAGDELVAEAFEVGEGEVLAGASEVLTGVGGHGRRRYGGRCDGETTRLQHLCVNPVP
jgi:hypothetical protein